MKKYTKAEIVEMLSSTDRRAAYFTAEDRDRVLATPALEKRIAGIKENADKYRGKPIPTLKFSAFKLYEMTGDRTEFELAETGYFSRRRRLLAFALLSWLYERDEDISELEDIMWAIMDEYTWALPAHLGGRGLAELQDNGYTVDLFAAETSLALMEAVSLLEHKLSPIVVARAKHLVKERVLDRYSCNFGWRRATHNWAAVCSGNMGMAAMYSDEDNERVADIILVVLDSLESYLSGFAADGACLEGLGYWSYGFGYFMCFAEMLLRRTGGGINLFDDEKVHAVATFYQKCFFEGGRIVTFSDASPSAKFSLGTVSMLSRFYDDIVIPERKYLALANEKSGCARFAFGVRNLAWATKPPSEDGTMTFGTHIFPDGQWYISTSENGVGIAAKAGNNSEPHNHNDVGAFHIYKHGETVIADIGGGEYSSKYFNKNTRYSYFCCSSEGHSVPIIDGGTQQCGSEYAAKGTVLTENGITADIAAAYGNESLKELVRSIDFNRKSGVTTVSDRFVFETEPKSVVERFITVEKPTVSDGIAKIPCGDGEAELIFDSSMLSASVREFHDTDHVAKPRVTYSIDLEIKSPSKEFCVEIIIK